MAAILLALSVGTAWAVEEIAVEAQVENGPLRGTLRAPDGAAKAAIVIIPGSGPTDRDGNNPLGVEAASLRMLAEALAGHGIASIRADKRGLFASRGSFPDPNAVTFHDYAADARAWAMVAKEKTGADCAWLAGHSEGRLVAGGADLQVGAADAEALALAQPRAAHVTIAEMNHVLKAVPDGDTAANLAAYGDPRLPLAPGLAEAIAEFVLRRR